MNMRTEDGTGMKRRVERRIGLICVVVVFLVAFPATAVEWFDDFFFPELDNAWSWISEVPQDWSLAQRRGYLTIDPSPGSFPSDSVRNLLYQAVPGAFSAEAHLLLPEASSGLEAGLVLFDPPNLAPNLRIALVPCESATCTGWAVKWDQQASVPAGDDVSLRLAVADGEVSAFFKLADGVWTPLGSVAATQGWRAVGLYAIGETPEGKDVAFDYFRLVTAEETVASLETVSLPPSSPAPAETTPAAQPEPPVEPAEEAPSAPTTDGETSGPEEPTERPEPQEATVLPPALFTSPEEGSSVILVSAAASEDPDFVPEPDEAGAWGYRIYALDVASGALRNLTAPGVDETGAEWSSDRTRFAVLQWVDPAHNRIVIAPASGQGREAVTDDRQWRSALTWTPADAWLAFVNVDEAGPNGRLERGDESILAITPDGRDGRVVLGPVREGIADLEWAPDNAWIAFSYSSGGGGLAVVRPTGLGQERVTTFLNETLDIAWSPDARRLAFISRSQTSILAWEPDSGSFVTVWEQDPTFIGRASYIVAFDWSPDGGRLALVKYELRGGAGDRDYYVEVVDLRTGDAERFDLPGRGLQVSWD